MHGSGWRSFYIACNLDASSNLTRAWRRFTVDAGERYDAIVVGSGQAGTPLSRALAEAGMGTALVEREHVGGTCVNEGCTPTKTMVASARVAYLARRGANYGVQTRPITIDLKRVRERKREIVKSFREGNQARIEKTPNLSLIFGTASFRGPKTLAVRGNDGSERSLVADKIFINAGKCRNTGGAAGAGRTGPGPVSGQQINHGTGLGARAAAGAGRGIRRAGIRADVPTFWQPRDRGGIRTAIAGARGSGCGGRGGEDPAGGWDCGHAALEGTAG